MSEKRCSKCTNAKPESGWSPSQWRQPGPAWCRECYSDWHRARYETKDGGTDEPRDCRHCGNPYRPGQRRPSAFCSRACKDGARCAASRAARNAAKLAEPDRRCPHCGDLLDKLARVNAKFCSAACNSKAHALQRKLRARTGGDGKPGYVRALIAERDGWACGVCSEPVDRALVHPDPLCGSLDHVIPVAHGGTNDAWNLRLTHLVCNLRRGAALSY